MVWNEKIEGKHVSLRSAEIEDAQFTYDIRQDKEKTKFIHQLNGTVEDQKKWLSQQRKREGDYFFVVETKEGVPIGTSSVYNIQGDEGEGGRILLYGTPLQNAEAAILGYDFAFSMCGLNRLVLTVLENNIHVQGFVKKFGAKEEFRRYNDEFQCDMIYYYVTEEMYLKRRERIMRSIEMMA